MQVLGVFQIHFEDPAFAVLPFAKVAVCVSRFPFEARVGKRLTHGLYVEVVCIVIHDVVGFFCGVIIHSVWIVCFDVSFGHHTSTTTHTFFDK